MPTFIAGGRPENLCRLRRPFALVTPRHRTLDHSSSPEPTTLGRSAGMTNVFYRG
jgi:hypothetical protein